MSKRQSIIILLLICILLSQYAECKRDTRNLLARSRRSSRSTSSRSTSSSSSSSSSTSPAIIIAIVVPIAVFLIIFAVIRAIRNRQRRNALNVQPIGLNNAINQQNLNSQMQQANQVNGIPADPYFQNNMANINNQNQFMHPIQNDLNQQKYPIEQQQFINGQYMYQQNNQPYQQQQQFMMVPQYYQPQQQVNGSMIAQQQPLIQNATVL